eukprot:TRINITY_DN1918_c0_g1_i1.p1 TRINITY_DN1918_c0_g1~~TRINITY_DN1918_c0_g1_i1.p1  ORF type:complete len:302 (-),score=38.88 TRINITY_DN1918_c0_g1_i1:144-1049(-)
MEDRFINLSFTFLLFLDDQDHWTVLFPACGDVPEGFTNLVSLLNFVVKGAGESILQIKHDNETRLFHIVKMIGKGRCSLVFEAKNEVSKRVCIKIEPCEDCSQITNEINILRNQLFDCIGVPKLLFDGETEYLGTMWRAIVTGMKYKHFDLIPDVVGDKTLEDFSFGDRLVLEDVANQAIDILEAIHKRGVIHKDIKPSHLVFFQNSLYLIDFGAAGPPGPSDLVTWRFASILGHFKGLDLDEKSDFESLWFSFLSLHGKLPWDGVDQGNALTLKLRSKPCDLQQQYPTLANIFYPLLEAD